MTDPFDSGKLERKLILIRNERAKLRANSLDRLSTASVAAGFIGPVASISSGGFETAISLSIAASTFIWLAAALLLHMSAQFMLGRLEP